MTTVFSQFFRNSSSQVTACTSKWFVGSSSSNKSGCTWERSKVAKPLALQGFRCRCCLVGNLIPNSSESYESWSIFKFAVVVKSSMHNSPRSCMQFCMLPTPQITVGWGFTEKMVHHSIQLFLIMFMSNPRIADPKNHMKLVSCIPTTIPHFTLKPNIIQ